MAIPAALEPSIPWWAVMSPKRRAHVERVATLVATWADAMELAAAERSRWLRAAWLHDALRDADPVVLKALAGGLRAPVDLLHGPAAAERAAKDPDPDPGVLDAVRYHSVGFAKWEPVGRALYCADFLEPGRRFDRAERARLAERFPVEPDVVFAEVVRRRMLYLVHSGWPIPEPTFLLWNSQVDR